MRFPRYITLILGCTHYPIIRNQISRYLNFEINVVDTARIVALTVQKYQVYNILVGETRTAESRFYVSDRTTGFEVIANMFFSKKIHLEKRNIWN